MPQLALRRCSKCRRLIRGACPDCYKDKDRVKTWDKIYSTYKWTAFRKNYIRRHPYCILCRYNNKWTATKVLHHILSPETHMNLAYDEDNIRPVCQDCHAEIHNNPDVATMLIDL